MSDLTEFLLARIAEDESVSCGCLLGEPSRVLAECETKRAIVTLCGAANAPVDCHITLSLMTLPYADHPDYREKWKP